MATKTLNSIRGPERNARTIARRTGLTWLRSRMMSADAYGELWEHEFAYYEPQLRWYLVLRATGEERAEIRHTLEQQIEGVRKFLLVWRAT